MSNEAHIHEKETIESGSHGNIWDEQTKTQGLNATQRQVVNSEGYQRLQFAWAWCMVGLKVCACVIALYAVFRLGQEYPEFLRTPSP